MKSFAHSFVVLATLLLVFLAGGFVFAQSCTVPADCAPGTTCIGGECLQKLPGGPQSPGEVLAVIAVIANWMFAIFLAIAVIFLIWGAFEFVTGEGQPDKVSSAKRRLLYAIIGIGLALLANGVDDVLRSILT